MEGANGLLFLFLLAQLVVEDAALLIDFKLVAKEGGIAESGHEGGGELEEGIGEDDEAGTGGEPLGKLDGSGEGLKIFNGLVDGGERELVAVKDIEPVAHEDIVVGLIAGGAAEFGDTGGIGHGDPEFG